MSTRLNRVMSLISGLRCSVNKRTDALSVVTRSILQRLRWIIATRLVVFAVYCIVAAISFLERLRTLLGGTDKNS